MQFTKRMTRAFIFAKLLCFPVFFSTIAICQEPDTEIYFGDFSLIDSELKIEKLRNITNREGYDNQPFFHPSEPWLYYTSKRNDNQTDIYRFEWKNFRSYKVTDTYEDEYSPQVIPNTAEFSTVRVELGKKQRLWSFDIKNPEFPKLLVEDIDNVGYTCWISTQELFMFGVNEADGHHLLRVNSAKGKSKLIDKEIGRSLIHDSKHNQLIYVSKKDSSSWNLVYYDYDKKKEIKRISALQGEEDYCLLKNESLISGKGEKIFQYADGDWIEKIDLGNRIEGRIERIQIHPEFGKIAIVTQIIK